MLLSLPFRPTRREGYIALAVFVIFILSQHLRTSAFGSGDHSGGSNYVPPFLRSKGSTAPNVEGLPRFDQYGKPRVSWTRTSMPQTKLVRHPFPGYTVLDNLYAWNGSLVIVADDPKPFPPRRMMISNGLEGSGDPVVQAMNEPTDQSMRIISTSEAFELFGLSAGWMDGVTWIQNDPPQFLDHMYHNVVEILSIGLWRIYSTLDPSITPSGLTTLPPPRRMIYPHSFPEEWADHAGMNAYVWRAAFPSISIEGEEDWLDHAVVSTSFPGVGDDGKLHPGGGLIFDRVVLGDREAWHRGQTFEQRNPNTPYRYELSPFWWEPVRRNVVRASGGFLGDVLAENDRRPVITYVSRQLTTRRLTDESHVGLVKALIKLGLNNDWEVNVATMERMTHAEQVKLASRTTVIIGVHGNGLSAQLWMHPTQRSTVVEIFVPEGFTYDYEYTARSLGLRHYGVWDTKWFTAPKLPPINFPDGFHGPSIPVSGDAIALLVHRRLTLSNPDMA